MSIRILYNGCSFGPIHAPSSLNFICRALKINQFNTPVLKNTIHDQDSISGWQADVPAGVYELLVNKMESHPTQEESIHKQTTDTMDKQCQTQDVDLGDTRTSSETQRPPMVQEQNHWNATEEEMDLNIYELTNILANIPSHRYKNNVLLASAIKKANDSIESLQQKLEKRPASIQRRIMIKKDMIWAMTQVYQTYLVKSGPSVTPFKGQDMKSFEAYKRAMHVLTKIQMWRNINYNSRWESTIHSTTLNHLWDPAKVFRQLNYHPNTFLVTDGMDYKVADEDKMEIMIEQGASKHLLLKEFRKSFMHFMVATKLHTTMDLRKLLTELLNSKIGDTKLPEDQKISVRAFLRSQMEQEFQLK